MKPFRHLLIAVLVGYTLSVILNTSVSAATLQGFGIDVGLYDRLAMAATEWVGLATVYLPLYLILHGTVFWLVDRVTGGGVFDASALRWVFAVAGALSLMTLYLTFDRVMGSSGVLVASTRTTSGLLLQMGSGAVSGFLFCLLRQRNNAPIAD